MLCVCVTLLFLTLTAQAYTTEVHVVKYAPDGATIWDEITVNYSWMEATLPVYGDGETHYYFQGPVFESEWNQVHEGEPWNMWNPTEDVNVETRDYGAVKGTNVADLCDLVGGMESGQKVRIKASDGFYKWFPYDDIYNYTAQPQQGPMVLAWFNGEDGYEHQGEGYPDERYSSGMRLFFFADTSTNDWGYHCFGDWDMHQYMEEQYWHYYSGDILYPSSSGLSVKWVSDIEIYTGEVNPDLIVTAIDTPDGIYNGTSNIISATIENIGNMGTFRPFNVTINDGSGVVDSTVVDIGELGAGENITVKFLWTPAAPTTYTLNVSADSDGFVAEGNETNNHMTKGVTVIPIPQTDFVVSMVHNGTAFINEPNVIFALIKNNGADAHRFNVSLEVDGALKDKVFVPMLHLRETQLVPFNWTPTILEDKTVYVRVDCNNDVTESNETNNVMSQLVDVASLTMVTVGDGQNILQATIDAASSGTKILVAGTHNEQVVIPSAKAAIRLIANGSNAVIYNNTPGDIIKVEAPDCWVQGFSIHSTWNKDGEDDDEDFANYPGAGINITSNSWNVVKDNYIYNSSSGVNLYSSCNLFMNNTIGDTKAGRDCRRLMIISGDTNRIVKNVFDGNTSRHSWVLGGVLNYEETKYRVTAAPANGNLLRDNTFNVRGYHSPFVVFSGDQNLVFNNDINDTGTEIVAPSKLNWYYVDKATVDTPKYGNIVHGQYYGGNCWSGYTGTDNDQDLLGDTAYNGYDAQPLIRATCGDVDCNGGIKYLDVFKLKKHYNDPGYLICSEWAGDVDGIGGIKYLDVFKLKKHYNDPSFALSCCTDVAS
jgi:nitrous oxidase accessory protein NosD